MLAAAIFVILTVGFLGGCVPLFIKAFQRSNSRLARYLRAFSGGVLLALALVHVGGGRGRQGTGEQEGGAPHCRSCARKRGLGTG